MAKIPEWARSYIAHLDSLEALGLSAEDAHAAWKGDPKIAERGAAYTWGYNKGTGAPSKLTDDEIAAELGRRHRALTNSLLEPVVAGIGPTRDSIRAAYDRGCAEYDATLRPTTRNRHAWGLTRADAFMRLASHLDTPEGYTADLDLLSPRHPKALRAPSTTAQTSASGPDQTSTIGKRATAAKAVRIQKARTEPMTFVVIGSRR